MLLGQIAEARCTQVVNPKYTYICKVDKKITHNYNFSSWRPSIAGSALASRVVRIVVPRGFESMVNSPLNWRMRSRIPVIPTPAPCD